MIRRLCIKLCTTRIDGLVGGDDSQRFTIRTNCHFVLFENMGKLTIGKSKPLCTAQFMSTQLSQRLPFQRMPLIDDDLHLVKKPHVNLCCIVYLINTHASAKSLTDLEDSLGGSNRGLHQQIHITETVVQRFSTVTIQAEPALFK